MGTCLLSIDEQRARMAALWPRFSVGQFNRQRQEARWIGEVRPQFTRFTIDVRYRMGVAPKVRVLRPTLVRLLENAEGQLPHVYPPTDDPTLCLFDPAANEWDATMYIAETTIPWSFDWIACYELWLMTERWTGGGRHGSLLPDLGTAA